MDGDVHVLSQMEATDESNVCRKSVNGAGDMAAEFATTKSSADCTEAGASALAASPDIDGSAVSGSLNNSVTHPHSRKRHRRRKKTRGQGKKPRLRDGKSAPFNSTQFLIADHGAETPAILRSPSRLVRSVSAESSQSDYDTAEDDAEEEEFQQKDFDEAFAEAERSKNDSLIQLSKVELIQRCQDAELKNEVDRAELVVLREENERLREEIRLLKLKNDEQNKDIE